MRAKHVQELLRGDGGAHHTTKCYGTCRTRLVVDRAHFADILASVNDRDFSRICRVVTFDDLDITGDDQIGGIALIAFPEDQIAKGYDTANRKEIAVVDAGEYVGEMGAIDDQPRSASAVALGGVVCAPVTPDEFLNMLRMHPDEAIDLLKVLFNRLREASRRLAEIDPSGAG